MPFRVSCQGFPSSTQSITFGHATIARYTYYTHFLFRLSVSVRPPAPSTSPSPLPYLPSIVHTRLAALRIRPAGSGTRRHETRRGQPRPGEAVRDARHRTTPNCGLRRRSSRHHRSPPNLGKTTQLSARETAAGNRQSAVQNCPLARPCTGLDKLFLILAHPAHATRDPAPVGSTYLLSLLHEGLSLCRAAVRLGMTERSRLRAQPGSTVLQ